MKNLSKKEQIAVIAGILVVGFFFVFGSTIVSIIKTGSLMGSANQAAPAPTNLVIQDVAVGTGDEAVPGDKVTVNYVGTFTNGQTFDSSIARGEPFTFTLGAGQVIPGWDRGFVGMKVGGKRVLIVPPELGYGANDYGPIPGNSTLVFQVELLKVEK